MSAGLFTPLQLRGVTLPNRVGASPMCQYVCEDGMASDWHLAHLGSFAIGGAGLVFAECTAVAPEGRLSPGDLGLWKDEQVEPLARVTRFLTAQGAVPAVQLGHAGRKASGPPPWGEGRRIDPQDGGWRVRGAGSAPFAEGSPVPLALADAEVAEVPRTFAGAARRALRAGFQAVELHAAHGYLLHQFLSPLTNTRADRWGGSFDGRVRLTLDVAAALREEIGEDVPLLVRVSATDWVTGGWDGDDTVELARRLRALGVDLVDCSTGGLTPDAKIPVAPGFQVRFAEAVRREAGVASAAVGVIVEPRLADAIVREGRADVVLLGRALLRNPAWAHEAARTLGAQPRYPLPYEWALQGMR